jgi:hypothetical protein
VLTFEVILIILIFGEHPYLKLKFENGGEKYEFIFARSKGVVEDPSLCKFIMFFYLISLDGNLRNAMNRGINYLAENWANIDPKENPHTLAIVTYVLHLAVHPQKDQVDIEFKSSYSYIFQRYFSIGF